MCPSVRGGRGGGNAVPGGSRRLRPSGLSRYAASAASVAYGGNRGRGSRRLAALSGAGCRDHPLEELPREPHSTARVYRFADGQGEIGFVNPVSEPFCGDCNRVRLTADGKLRTCLFSLGETDLREVLRSGASDAEVERVIRDAVWRKELKHHVGEAGFRQPPRTMSAIGG